MGTPYSEVESKIAGLHNYVVPIPGSTVAAHLGVHDGSSHWAYSIWGSNDSSLIAAGWLDMTGIQVTPDQVGRVAYLLEVEYSTETE